VICKSYAFFKRIIAMKTKADIERGIVNITTRINNDFPELSKFITEMPNKNLGNLDDGINVNNLEEYYNSLVELLSEYAKTHEGITPKQDVKKNDYGDDLIYPPSEDIYSRSKEETELNPEDLSSNKTPNEKVGLSNEKDFMDDISGDDLDIPGSELDNKQEAFGNEDEENNYYSLGGDAHNDLDEN
jgi:hypothetical protein